MADSLLVYLSDLGVKLLFFHLPADISEYDLLQVQVRLGLELAG